MQSLALGYRRFSTTAFSLAVVMAMNSPVSAVTIAVPADFATIGQALVAASDGDRVEVAAGIYSPSTNGESFPITVTNDVRLVGTGWGSSILDAEQTATTVVFDALLGGGIEGFTITGGFSPDRGGGIQVRRGNPELANNLVWNNGAKLSGSGINLQGTSTAWVHHNVVWENYDTDLAHIGDPHGMQYRDSSAGICEHNVVGRTDSNGLFYQESSEPTIRHNVFYQNGIPGVRGRGICAFGTNNAVVAHNLFFDNAIASMVLPGTIDVDAQGANDFSSTDGIYGNLDGDPLFRDTVAFDFALAPMSAAIDAGDPLLPLDPDGTVADVGAFYFNQNATAAEGLPDVVVRAVDNFPNPFNPSTNIRYEVSQATHVRLQVVDLRGRHVVDLVDQRVGAGSHHTRWSGIDERGESVASGVYLARVMAGGEQRVAAMVLVR